MRLKSTLFPPQCAIVIAIIAISITAPVYASGEFLIDPTGGTNLNSFFSPVAAGGNEFDDGVAVRSLGFNFTEFGLTRSGINITTNGFIQLREIGQTANASPANVAFPTTGGIHRIAGAWDDLAIKAGDSIVESKGTNYYAATYKVHKVTAGGGAELSFNLIAGAPGSGKTTLAHQIMFANATPERPALYFTILGEPALKILRYQQQFEFFDAAKMGSSIRFINLSQMVLEQDLSAVLDEITREVKEANPGIVIVDSFRTVVRKALADPTTEVELQAFVQSLALKLTSWEATTFLIGEYVESEMRDNPVFTVADGLFWLSQNIERNSIVRKLQIMKLRGQAPVPGLHTFRITTAGLQVFPRTFGTIAKRPHTASGRRLSTGIQNLDDMLSGGIPEGDSVLVAGPSGTGKSVLAVQFIAEGIRQNEPGVIAVFEERPEEYVERAAGLGFDLTTPQDNGTLEIIYLRPLDLSVDETLYELLEAIERIGAKRVVIDSLAGFEMALAPAFRQDFRESLYRMIGTLTGTGVTVLSTVELQESFTDLLFSPHAISFLTDDIIRFRYVEIEGQLRKIMMIVKMRGGNHSKDIREYEITDKGLVIGGRLRTFRGLITGVPEQTNPYRLGNERST